MYLSAVVGMLSGIASPMIRAILSKSVPPEDTGKNSYLTSNRNRIIVSHDLYHLLMC